MQRDTSSAREIQHFWQPFGNLGGWEMAGKASTLLIGTFVFILPALPLDLLGRIGQIVAVAEIPMTYSRRRIALRLALGYANRDFFQISADPPVFALVVPRGQFLRNLTNVKTLARESGWVASRSQVKHDFDGTGHRPVKMLALTFEVPTLGGIDGSESGDPVKVTILGV
jgi:hypothetical protein